jgi:hypothetical protein
MTQGEVAKLVQNEVNESSIIAMIYKKGAWPLF